MIVKRKNGSGALKSETVLPLLLLLAVIAMRLLAIPFPGPLDSLAPPNDHAARRQADGQSFPGSAFLLAGDGFDPAAGAIAYGPLIVLEVGPAAPSVPFRGLTALDRYRATNCLAAAVYYEAGNEPADGRRAVAQVVLNRVRNPAWPNSVCGVVYQGSERIDGKCQFSFACDGAMARIPDAAGWAGARAIAADALAGRVFAPVGLATHYHTLAVNPGWSAGLRPVAVVGAHVFYRWKGMAGMPAGFSDRYAERETLSGPLAPVSAMASLAAASALPVPTAAPQPLIDRPAATPVLALPASAVRAEYRDSGRLRP